MSAAASQWDIEVAARTAWGEARGEGPVGLSAVAHVFVNRLKLGRWYSGGSLADCCMMFRQFSCWNSADPNRTHLINCPQGDLTLTQCRQAVSAALAGDEDPTLGATHYYAPAGIDYPPSWVTGATFCAEIGKHKFYKDVK